MTNRELYRQMQRDYPEVYMYVKKAKLKKLLKIILIDAAVILSLYFSRDAFIDKGFFIPLIASAVVLCLVIPFVIKPHILLTARINRGKIESMQYENRNAMYAHSYQLKLTRLSQSIVVIITYADEKNRAFELILPKQFDGAYGVGDEIIKFPGYDYPVNLANPSRDKLVCIKCGNIVPKEEASCVGCGCDIVKLKN